MFLAPFHLNRISTRTATSPLSIGCYCRLFLFTQSRVLLMAMCIIVPSTSSRLSLHSLLWWRVLQSDLTLVWIQSRPLADQRWQEACFNHQHLIGNQLTFWLRARRAYGSDISQVCLEQLMVQFHEVYSRSLQSAHSPRTIEGMKGQVFIRSFWKANSGQSTA